jgi:hypothetical protein
MSTDYLDRISASLLAAVEEADKPSDDLTFSREEWQRLIDRIANAKSSAKLMEPSPNWPGPLGTWSRFERALAAFARARIEQSEKKGGELRRKPPKQARAPGIDGSRSRSIGSATTTASAPSACSR